MARVKEMAAKAKAYMQSIAGENHALSGIPEDAPAAVCRNGTFVGKREGDVAVFRGIPFAEPPDMEIPRQCAVLPISASTGTRI